MRAKRTFTREFKLEVVRAIQTGQKRLSQSCREHDLCESVLRRWVMQYQAHGESAFTEEARRDFAPAREDTARIKELEAALGRAHLEIEFLKEALSKKGSWPAKESR
jgi:transposase